MAHDALFHGRFALTWTAYRNDAAQVSVAAAGETRHSDVALKRMLYLAKKV
jgi:hypothetical protein